MYTRTLFPPAEEAAGAGGHDGPVLLPAEAHPEDQQVQPPAAGHAGSLWLTQAQRHDPGLTARFQHVPTECERPGFICAWSDEQGEGAREGWDPGCCRSGPLSNASWQRFAHHGRHPGLWCKIIQWNITNTWYTAVQYKCFLFCSAVHFSAPLSGEFKGAGPADSPGWVQCFLPEEEMCPPHLSIWRSHPLQQN